MEIISTPKNWDISTRDGETILYTRQTVMEMFMEICKTYGLHEKALDRNKEYPGEEFVTWDKKERLLRVGRNFGTREVPSWREVQKVHLTEKENEVLIRMSEIMDLLSEIEKE